MAIVNAFGEINVFDFMTMTQVNDITLNIGSIDVSLPCQKALDSGASTVIFPQGTYLVNGLSVGTNFQNNDRSKPLKIIGRGTVKILLNHPGIVIFSVLEQRHFITIENFILDSLQQDNKCSYGILFQGSNAHTILRNINFSNFRGGCGIEYRQTVNSSLENIIGSNCMYGILFQKYNGVPCTTVSVNRAYITVCKRAISHIDAVSMDYHNCIAEYCGSKTSNDAAYHFEGGHCQLYNVYGEANYRNFILAKVKASFIGEKYIVDDMVNNPPAPNIII